MVLSLTIVSCEDFYQAPLEQSIEVDDIFSTETSARTYLNEAYYSIRHKFVTATSDYAENGIYLYKRAGLHIHSLASISDEAICSRSIGGFNSYVQDIITPTYWDGAAPTYIEDHFAGYYVFIRRLLTYIANVNTIPNVSSSFVTETTAEANALMAACYFEMMKRYGALPWIDQTYVGSESDLTTTLGTRPALADYIANLDALLVDAIDGLPDSYSSTADQGKVTKAFAHFIRSRVWLWAASPLFNKRNAADYSEAANHEGEVHLNYATSYDSSLWDKAATVTKAAIDYCEGQGLTLVDTGNPVDDYNTAVFSLTGNTEYAFFTRRLSIATAGTQFYSRHLPPHRLLGTTVKTSAENGAVSPTQEMVNKYRLSTGEFLVEDPYDMEDPDLVAHYANNSNPWENLEPRFHASFFYDDLTVVSSSADYTFYAEPHYTSSAGVEVWDTWATGYCMRKFIPDLFICVAAAANVSIDLVDVCMRLPELYLNYAEILCEQGDLSTALTYAKKTMARVDLPVDAMTFPSTQDGMREVVRKERAVELAFEDFRYFDCKRWLEGDLTACTKHGVKYTVSGTDSSNGFVFAECDASKQYSVNPYPKHYLWPIPQEEIRKDYGLVQNPNY